MTDLFRSALSYINAGASAAGVSMPSTVGRSPTPGAAIGVKPEHELVGSNVEIGGLKLRIRYLIAEGGFALVFGATDSQNRPFALKRQLASDRDAADAIIAEIRYLRQLTGHPNIIEYVQAASLTPQECSHGRAEYLVLTELCSGGPLVDALRRVSFNVEDVCLVMNAACQATKHMHSQSPPIIHRDLKVENLLLDSKGFVKLCDFGSATTETYYPDCSWSAAKRTQVEEDQAMHTTPMYRAPEMLDLYQDLPIDKPLDIWALGCILYYICYRVHPFEDSAKLRIINANYTLPENETPFTPFHPLISSCLSVQPQQRPLIEELCERVQVLAVALDVDLRKPCTRLMSPDHTPAPSVSVPPPRPVPTRPAPPHSDTVPAQTQPQGADLLSSLKGQAGSLFKNIRDTGSKVVHGVHMPSTAQHNELQLTYLTSRVLLVPLPESLPIQSYMLLEDSLRARLEHKHSKHYAVYNLSNRSIHILVLRQMQHSYDGRLSDVPLPSNGRAPSLHALFAICHNMNVWLKQTASNVLVLCGSDEQCTVLACALLLYCRVTTNADQALQLCAARSTTSTLNPSTHRYLRYTTMIAQANQPLQLNERALLVESVSCSPVPLFNKAHTGCRPFMDVWSSGQKVFSTAADSIEHITVYDAGQCSHLSIPVNTVVCDDVTICLFHARSTLGAKVQGRFAGLPMARVSLHTCFVQDDGLGVLEFGLNELDDIDDVQRYTRTFTLQIKYSFSDELPAAGRPAGPSFHNHDFGSTGARLLLADKAEKDGINALLGLSTNVNQSRSPQAGRAPPPTRPPSRPPAPTPSPAVPVSESLIPDLQAPAPVPVESLLIPDLQGTSMSEPATTMETQSKPAAPATDFFNTLAWDQSATPVEQDAVVTPPKSPSPTVDYGAEQGAPVADLLNMSLNSDTQLPIPTVIKTGTSDVIDDFFGASATDSSTSKLSGSNMDLFTDWDSHTQTQAAANNIPRNQSEGVLNTGRKAQPQSKAPNYSSSVFDSIRQPAAQTASTAIPSKMDDAAFDDILSSQGFTSSAKATTKGTMGQQQRLLHTQDMDPVQLKIHDWTLSKERNIRALLCSLHEVMWEDASSRWTAVSMADLLTAAQIKKQYRRACLAVHPDKLTGSEHQPLAKAIFTELNDAWNAFEQAGEPALS